MAKRSGDVLGLCTKESAFDLRAFDVTCTHPRKQLHTPIDRKGTVMIATAIIWALILCLSGTNWVRQQMKGEKK
jgi:hypothetical protein